VRFTHQAAGGEIEAVNVGAGNARAGRWLGIGELDVHSPGDGAADFGLDREYVVEASLKGLRPQAHAVARIDQGDIYAHAAAFLADAALEQIGDIETTADFRGG
jgi:hypothetical protein